ncbi:MAG TPA: hypothetical protein VK470_10040 [Bacteroidota bacterium]|nr:hypothetical protein [Bacteroidota bacterium]
MKKRVLVRGVKTVSFEEGFVDELQREEGSIPRMLLIECAAQLVSWLVLCSTDFEKIPLIAKIDLARIERGVRCGEAIALEARVRSWNEDGAIVDCDLSADDGVIASGVHCLCSFIESRTLVDPQEMKLRFNELAKAAHVE